MRQGKPQFSFRAWLLKKFRKIKGVDFLPEKYRILPHIIDFDIPHFKFSAPGSKTLSAGYTNCKDWMIEFSEVLSRAIGKRFLPVVRFCDGEYIFILGDPRPSLRFNGLYRLYFWIKRFIKSRILHSRFIPETRGLYRSGNYSRKELKDSREGYINDIKWISERGILAMQLDWNEHPFTEAFWPGLREIFLKNAISLRYENYFPFYFIYAFLAGPAGRDFFRHRRVLVINAATGEKREKIQKGLIDRGAKQVSWITISRERSLFDTIDVEPFINRIDIALVGAGVGKLHIFRQMEPLMAPCLDIGFFFEVLGNADMRFQRAYCCPDEDFLAKVQAKP